VPGLLPKRAVQGSRRASRGARTEEETAEKTETETQEHSMAYVVIQQHKFGRMYLRLVEALGRHGLREPLRCDEISDRA